MSDYSDSRSVDQIRRDQQQEHRKRENRERRKDERGGRSKLQTRVEKRSQAWDPVTITAPSGDSVRLRIVQVLQHRMSILLTVEGDCSLYIVDGNGDETPTRSALERSPEQTVELDQYPSKAWDWLQIVFDGEELPVDVIISRAWYTSVALVIIADRDTRILKSRAPG